MPLRLVNVFSILRLLLPALIPSWRFFDTIAPSPRIQFALVAGVDESSPSWREFRPHPVKLSFISMLQRLLWNPRWNESAYMVTCTESLLAEPSAMRENELLRRIGNAIANGEVANDLGPTAFLLVRIIVCKREGGQITQQAMMTLPPRSLNDAGKRTAP